MKLRTFSFSSALTLLAISSILAGCKKSANPPAAEQPVPQASLQLSSTAPNQAAGVAWSVPAGWELDPARPMRVATYRVHAIVGDPEDAECAVYFFGAGQGGTVQANLDRWAGQFQRPDGQSAAESAKVDQRAIAGLKVSTLTISGTYLGAGMAPSQAEAKKPNYRMLGAIVEAPGGLVFFKFTGPLNTVAAAENDFNSLLQSLHSQ